MTNIGLHKFNVITKEAWQSVLSQVENNYNFALIIVVKNANKNLKTYINRELQQNATYQLINIDNYDSSDNTLISDILTNIDTKADRITTNIEVMRYLLNSKTSIEPRQFIHKLQKKFNNNFDCHLLPIDSILQDYKIACFDMDSTLIEQEVIVELAKATGIGEQVNEITEQAMRGEIDFNQSFTKRVRLLEGTSANVLANINQNLTLSAGAKTTLALLNGLGFYTVLISGGFVYFAQAVADKLNLDEYHANELLIDNKQVTGDVNLPILDSVQKAKIVKKIAQQQGVSLDEVICIGDGANDLAMMKTAHLGIAYHAKPIVQQQADIAINYTGLEGVLYALGYGKLFE